jgi:hypothetical protein
VSSPIKTYHFSPPLETVVCFGFTAAENRLQVFFIYVILYVYIPITRPKYEYGCKFFTTTFFTPDNRRKVHSKKLGSFEQKGMADCV